MAERLTEVIASKFAYEVANKLSNLDAFKRTVESDTRPSQYATPEATVILAVPPTLEVIQTDEGAPLANAVKDFKSLCYPIGFISRFQLSEAKMSSSAPELGSYIRRVIPGSVQYRASISNLRTSSRNIKYALYSYIRKLAAVDDTVQSAVIYKLPGPVAIDTNTGSIRLKHWSGLNSDIYKMPFGLMRLRITSGGALLGCDYLENVMIPNYGKSVQAGTVSVVDNLSLFVGRVVPLTTSTGAGVAGFTAGTNMIASNGTGGFAFSTINHGDS